VTRIKLGCTESFLYQGDVKRLRIPVEFIEFIFVFVDLGFVSRVSMS
jgi:hypothetical protein